MKGWKSEIEILKGRIIFSPLLILSSIVLFIFSIYFPMENRIQTSCFGFCTHDTIWYAYTFTNFNLHFPDAPNIIFIFQFTLLFLPFSFSTTKQKIPMFSVFKIISIGLFILYPLIRIPLFRFIHSDRFIEQYTFGPYDRISTSYFYLLWLASCFVFLWLIYDIFRVNPKVIALEYLKWIGAVIAIIEMSLLLPLYIWLLKQGQLDSGELGTYNIFNPNYIFILFFSLVFGLLLPKRIIQDYKLIKIFLFMEIITIIGDIHIFYWHTYRITLESMIWIFNYIMTRVLFNSSWILFGLLIIKKRHRQYKLPVEDGEIPLWPSV